MGKIENYKYVCKIITMWDFRKIFGFEPSYSISLKGDAEERFEILAKMHRMKRVKRALLNNQFVNTSKRILLNNRFANLFRKNKTYN